MPHPFLPCKLLVTERKGYSFRLLEPLSGRIYRALVSDFPDLAKGDLLFVIGLVRTGDLIREMGIDEELTIKGSLGKKKVTVPTGTHRGDLVDGVPVLRLSLPFTLEQEKFRYAYFQ